MTIREDWKTAKGRLLDNKAGFPADIAKQLGKGADLGPALEQLEKAKNFPEQQKIMPQALKGKTTYETGIVKKLKELKAVKPTPNKIQIATIERFEKDLQKIWRDVEELCQPPRPIGRAEKIKLLYQKTIGKGLKLKHFVLEEIEVGAWIVIDETLANIIKEDLQGAIFIRMNQVLQKEFNTHHTAFIKTIEALDAKLTTVITDKTEREKKTKEANEVLAHYAKILEGRLNAVVEEQWKEFLARQAHLRAFKKECIITAVTNGIAIGVAAASAAMSFGAAIVNVLVIVKALGELVKVAERAGRSVEDAELDMRGRLDNVKLIIRNRLDALNKGEGQKLNKAGEMIKLTVTTMLGSYSKDFVDTVKYTESLAKEYSGKVSNLEKQAGEMYKKIDLMTKAFPSDTSAPSPAAAAKLKKAHGAFLRLKGQFDTFHHNVTERFPGAKRAIELCAMAKKLDPEVGKFETFLTVATTVAAVYSVGNLASLADSGKDILQHVGEVVTTLEEG